MTAGCLVSQSILRTVSFSALSVTGWLQTVLDLIF